MKHRYIPLFMIVAILMSVFVMSCDYSHNNTSETTLQQTEENQTAQLPDTMIESAAITTKISEVDTMIEKNNILYYKNYQKSGNWAGALEQALKENDVVYIPSGIYQMSSVTVPSGKTIYGDGDSTEIVALDKSLFGMWGSAASISPIAIDMEDFSNIITLKNSIGASAGDYIYLLSQRNTTILEDCGYDWCLARTYKSGTTVFFAEFLKVESVSDDGLIIKTETNTVFPYYYADNTRESIPKEPPSPPNDYPYLRKYTTVQKVDFTDNIVIKNLKISNCTGCVLQGKWMKDCLLENITMSTPSDSYPAKNFSFMNVAESIDCCVKDCRFNVIKKPVASLHTAVDDYSIYNIARIVSSYRCGFDSCYSDFSTHAFNITKADKRGTSYGCYVKNCTAENAIWSGIYIAGSCYNTTITGNKVTNSAQGIVCAGRKNYVANNEIKLSLSPLTDYYYVRPKAGGTAGIALIEGYSIDSIVENNTISEAYTAILIRDGHEETNIFESGNIIIRSNNTKDCRFAVGIYRHEINVGEKNLTVSIEGNSFTGGISGSLYTGVIAVMLDKYSTGITIKGNTIVNYPTISNLPGSDSKKIIIEDNK